MPFPKGPARFSFHFSTNKNRQEVTCVLRCCLVCEGEHMICECMCMDALLSFLMIWQDSSRYTQVLATCVPQTSCPSPIGVSQITEEKYEGRG